MMIRKTFFRVQYVLFIPLHSFLLEQGKVCKTCCSIFWRAMYWLPPLFFYSPFQSLFPWSNYWPSIPAALLTLPINLKFKSFLQMDFSWFNFLRPPFFSEKLIKSRKSSSPISAENDESEVKNRHRDREISPGKEKWYLTWTLNEFSSQLM